MAGRDFDLAFAPERVNPGDPGATAATCPRCGRPRLRRGPHGRRALLRRINATVHELSSPDAAELAKLLENVFRNVNIALVNQLALLCERMGLDVWEVIDAAATKPFGFMPFRPGPGVGGHCIPVDPYYLSWRARQFDFVDRFVEVAGDINLAMPRHVVDLVAEALNERGGPFVAPGRCHRRGVQAERPRPPQLAGGGRHRRARASVAPTSATTIRTCRRSGTRTAPCRGPPARRPRRRQSDVIVVVTPHRTIDWELVFRDGSLIVDTAPTASRPTRCVRGRCCGWARAGRSRPRRGHGGPPPRPSARRPA